MADDIAFHLLPLDQMCDYIEAIVFPKLERHIYYFSGRSIHPYDLDDIVSETLKRFWMHRPSFDANSPMPWLYKVAEHIFIDRRRKAYSKREVVSLDETSGDDSLKFSKLLARNDINLDAVPLRHEFRKALSELSDNEHRVFSDVVARHISRERLAQEMGVSKSKIEYWYSEAKRKLLEHPGLKAIFDKGGIR